MKTGLECVFRSDHEDTSFSLNKHFFKSRCQIEQPVCSAKLQEFMKLLTESQEWHTHGTKSRKAFINFQS